MEGPRVLRMEEMTSMGRLVDAVFMSGREGSMFRCFRQMFDRSNLSNHFVFVDDGRVVSHIGVTFRDASVGGCLIRVASIGAVATYEEYRGKGLASQLLDVTCAHAIAEGAHIMIISGDRTLYRRLGAAPVGIDYSATVSREAVLSLESPEVQVDDVTSGDLENCASEYAKRPAHFIRPASDWEWLLDSRICMGRDVHWLALRRKDTFHGYAIVSKPKEQGQGALLEYAGDELGLAGVLGTIMETCGLVSLELRLMQSDTTLLDFLRRAGIGMKAVPTSGTVLLLQPQELLDRLQPWFMAKVGVERARRLVFGAEVEKIVASDGIQACEWDRGQAAQAIFGHPDNQPLPGLLGQALPAPSLWCGVNYV